MRTSGFLVGRCIPCGRQVARHKTIANIVQLFHRMQSVRVLSIFPCAQLCTGVQLFVPNVATLAGRRGIVRFVEYLMLGFPCNEYEICMEHWRRFVQSWVFRRESFAYKRKVPVWVEGFDTQTGWMAICTNRPHSETVEHPAVDYMNLLWEQPKPLSPKPSTKMDLFEAHHSTWLQSLWEPIHRENIPMHRRLWTTSQTRARYRQRRKNILSEHNIWPLRLFSRCRVFCALTRYAQCVRARFSLVCPSCASYLRAHHHRCRRCRNNYSVRATAAGMHACRYGMPLAACGRREFVRKLPQQLLENTLNSTLTNTRARQLCENDDDDDDRGGFAVRCCVLRASFVVELDALVCRFGRISSPWVRPPTTTTTANTVHTNTQCQTSKPQPPAHTIRLECMHMISPMYELRLYMCYKKINHQHTSTTFAHT